MDVYLRTKVELCLQHTTPLFVTSQYSIEEIFGDDEKTVEALKRRFKVIHLPFKMDFDSGFELGLKDKDDKLDS